MNEIRIASISPFWRFAVVPSSNHSPGVAFWCESDARDFFNEMKMVLPWAGCVLVRRASWFKREVEVMEEYRGNPKSPLFESNED